MKNCFFEDCVACKTRSNSVFAALSGDNLQDLSNNRVCYKVDKGDYVFKEGTYPTGLYCVHQGKLKVVHMGVDGKEKIVHMVRNGNVMGYRAVLSGEKLSCSAVALEDSQLCFIPKNVFLALLEKSHKLALEVLHMVSTELRQAEKTITDLSSLPAKQRIAQALILLKERFGFAEDGKTLAVSLSREELANLAGTTRETVIRVLTAFDNLKIIELQAKKIKVLQLKKLIEAADVTG